MVGFGVFGSVDSGPTLVLPLIDSRTGGSAVAHIGPNIRANPFRWFIKLPDKEDAERLPAPMGFDRESIRFEPFLLYLDQMLPNRTHVTVDRVLCGSEAGSIQKTPMEKWLPVTETVHWPAIYFHMTALAPGQIIEFLGSSRWRRAPLKNKVDPWEKMTSGPALSEPRVLSVQCMIRLSWLPKMSQRQKIKISKGNPAADAPVAPVATAWAREWRMEEKSPVSDSKVESSDE